MKAGPRMGWVFHNLEWRSKRERAIMYCQGWMEPAHACSSLPGAGTPWRTMVWALQILYACRNLCLKPTAYNSLNLYYSSIDVLGKIFLSLCALCWALQDKYWPLQPCWFTWALLSSCDSRCDWKDALHSHPRSHVVHSGQPGFLISLLDPYAAL